MLNVGIRKYISTPILGLLPFILYLVLHVFKIKDQYALIASLMFSLISEIGTRRFLKSRIFSLTFYVSTAALLMTLIFWFFVHDYLERITIYPIFCEITVVCLFIVIRVSRTYISTIYLRKKGALQKAFFNEFYHIAALLQYALTIHIFTILIYRQFRMSKEIYDIYDIVFIILVPVIIIVSVGIYQMFRTRSIALKLRMEEWLPIVTDTGAVTGKISKKVSFNMKNKFLHPVVRVALTCKGKVFLQERAADDILNPRKLDYPFEKYLLFNHEINLAARNSIRRMIGDAVADIPLKFVLKYVFDNEETKRLIFLFVIEVENEDLIRRTSKMTGKFWSIKQIEEGFQDEVFAENFELEFEYMKNMILSPVSEGMVPNTEA